jgi:hypothetical protein
MAASARFGRIREIDVRLLAAVAAALLLIAGVMWVVPTTPNSNSFNFDGERRGLTGARPVTLDQPASGTLVDGSDTDYYRIQTSAGDRLNIHVANGSAKLIPAVRVLDAGKNVLVDKSVEYLRMPGADVDFPLAAEAGGPLFVQVSGQRNTTGTYTLTISAHHP